jgi:hypothetical protein
MLTSLILSASFLASLVTVMAVPTAVPKRTELLGPTELPIKELITRGKLQTYSL